MPAGLTVACIITKALVANEDVASPDEYVASFQRRMRAPGQASTSRLAVQALLAAGHVARAESWRLWPWPSRAFDAADTLPARMLALDGGLGAYLREHGPPDVIWVEGWHMTPELAAIFDACPDSFKVIYPQYWKPWEAEGLGRYDLCLADDEEQAARIRREHASLRCGVWDKVIDYERGHYPIDCEKEFDLCYVAFPSRRKNHELLFRAMAALPQRRLRAVCVGGREGDTSDEIAALARTLDLDVTFTGAATKAEVNEYVNKSRIGVICAKRDSAPRAMLEYMAADVPVLCNTGLRAGARYIGERGGLLRDPADFASGIEEILDHPERFSPRAHLLEHFSREQAVARCAALLAEAGIAPGGRTLRAAQR